MEKKELRKRFATANNTVEQYICINCKGACLCYCSPSSISANMDDRNVGNDKQHTADKFFL